MPISRRRAGSIASQARRRAAISVTAPSSTGNEIRGATSPGSASASRRDTSSIPEWPAETGSTPQAIRVGAEGDQEQAGARVCSVDQRPGREQQVDPLGDDQLADEDDPRATGAGELE